jgi:ferredoxin
LLGTLQIHRETTHMTDITFRSPVLSQDLTVYGVAGDRGTLLKVAQDNGIPLPFECEDGECGSCVVKVTLLTEKPFLAVDLTEKEKARLTELSCITPEEMSAAENDHVPPPYRMACQYIVRDEPIRVEFSGEAGTPVD